MDTADQLETHLKLLVIQPLYHYIEVQKRKGIFHREHINYFYANEAFNKFSTLVDKVPYETLIDEVNRYTTQSNHPKVNRLLQDGIAAAKKTNQNSVMDQLGFYFSLGLLTLVAALVFTLMENENKQEMIVLNVL